MARAVGLDIGLSSIKVCLLDGSPGRPRLVDFAVLDFERGEQPDEEQVAEAIDHLLSRHSIPRGSVVTALPARSVMLRDIQVPFLHEDQIAKTIKFQAEGAFHGVTVDQVVVDYSKYGEEGTKSRVLVAGVRKTTVARRLEFLERFGIDPVAIDLDVAAVYNAFTASEAYADDTNAVLCDLGSGSLKIVVVEHGRLRAVRSLRSRLSDLESIPEDVVREAGKSGPQPRPEEDVDPGGRLPLVILDEDESDVLDIMDSRIPEEARSDILRKILLEMDRTLASVRMTEPVDRIWLTGGGSAHPGVAGLFADHFGVPTDRLDLSEAVSTRLDKEQRAAFRAVGATSFGLALKGLGHDRAGFDLRREEYAFTGRFERLKKGVACLVCVLFVLFFALAYSYQIEMGRHQGRRSRALEQQKLLYQTFFQESPPEAAIQEGRIHGAWQDKTTEIEEVLGNIEGIPEVRSSLDMLAELTRAIRQSGVEVELQRADVKGLVEQTSVVTLATEQPDRCVEIQRLLEGNDWFTVSDPSITEDPREQGSYEVEFELRTIPEEGGETG